MISAYLLLQRTTIDNVEYDSIEWLTNTLVPNVNKAGPNGIALDRLVLAFANPSMNHQQIMGVTDPQKLVELAGIIPSAQLQAGDGAALVAAVASLKASNVIVFLSVGR